MRAQLIYVLVFSVVVLSSCTAGPHSVSHSKVILPDADDGLGGTGIEATDIRTVARKMAVSILETPEIMNAEERPKIALIPVHNSTRFIINKDIFTKKIRIELNKNASGKLRFLARDKVRTDINKYIMEERLIKREDKSEDEYGVTNVTASKDVDMLGVDFFLTGELTSLTKAVRSSRSDYILMSFQLIDAETSEIVWEDAYETKRVGHAGVAYQ
ncbi:MAG: penicillin-binding protein activator LpoB [Candidatus Zapsychrus exili]|nr:penicillin-binding protein activator LpoB [Candidatus Zapsychrus exili]